MDACTADAQKRCHCEDRQTILCDRAFSPSACSKRNHYFLFKQILYQPADGSHQQIKLDESQETTNITDITDIDDLIEFLKMRSEPSMPAAQSKIIAARYAKSQIRENRPQALTTLRLSKSNVSRSS